MEKLGIQRLLTLSPEEGWDGHGQRRGCVDGASWAPERAQPGFPVGIVLGSEVGASAGNSNPLWLGWMDVGWAWPGLESHREPRRCRTAQPPGAPGAAPPAAPSHLPEPMRARDMVGESSLCAGTVR